MAKYGYPPPPNPLPIVTNIYRGYYVADIYHPAQVHTYQIRGFVSAHAQFCIQNCLLDYFYVFFVSSDRLHPRHPHGFWCKLCYAMQGCCLLRGLQNQNLCFTPPYSSKTAIFGLFSTGLSNFCLKTALTSDMLTCKETAPNHQHSPTKVVLWRDKLGSGFQMCNSF